MPRAAYDVRASCAVAPVAASRESPESGWHRHQSFYRTVELLGEHGYVDSGRNKGSVVVSIAE